MMVMRKEGNVMKKALCAIIILLIALSFGCSSREETSGNPPLLAIDVPLPGILSAHLGGYDLQAEIEVSGKGTFQMTVNPEGSGTGHLELTLEPGNYTFTLTYYVMAGATRLDLATQSTTATILANQDNYIYFSSTAYDTNFDYDDDTYDNLQELEDDKDPLDPTSYPNPRCSNSIDDDGDGKIDYPDDPGCSGPYDNDESQACNDNKDNNANQLLDFPADPGCDSILDTTENPLIVTVNCPASIDETASTTCAISWTDADRDSSTLTCSLNGTTTCSGAIINDCSSVNIPAQGEAAGPGSCAIGVDVDVALESGIYKGSDNITINEVNQTPYFVSAPGGTSIAEGTLFTYNPTFTDDDLPNSAPTDPGYVSCARVANTCGSWLSFTGCNASGTPGETDAPGSCSYTLRITDGYGATNDQVVNLTLNEVNQIPYFTSSPVGTSINEGDAFIYNVIFTDDDRPNTSLSDPGYVTCAVVANTCGGWLVLNECNSSGMPGEADAPGSCSYTLRLTDGYAATADQVVDLTLNEVNQNPYFTSAPTGTSINEGSAFTYNPTFKDDDLPNTLATDPGYVGCARIANTCGAWLTFTGCSASGTPGEADAPGNCSYTLRITDGYGATASQTVTLTLNELNQNPYFTSTPATTSINEGVAWSYNPTFTDNDLPNSVSTDPGYVTCTVSNNTCVSWLSFTACNASGTLGEADAPGGCSYTLRLTDGYGATADQVVNLTLNEVNQSPVWASEPADIFVHINSPYTTNNGYATDSDLPNSGSLDPGHLICTNVSQTCSFTVMVSGEGNGEVNCNISFAGNVLPEMCSVDVQVSDGYDTNMVKRVAISVSIWHVDIDATGAQTGLTWTDAFTSLQEAINSASSGDIIFVAEGTYFRPIGGTEPVISMKYGVNIYGGFEGSEENLLQRGNPSNHPTILDGENASYHIVIGASYAHLDGFVITHGFANGPDGLLGLDKWGAGLFNDQITDLVVTNCSFIDNWAKFDGCGIANYKANNISVTYCIFDHNVIANSMGGGIINYVNNNISIDNCIFINNHSGAEGGGVHNEKANNITITNCIFIGNDSGYGGGISMQYSSVLIDYCKIANNSAGRGGGVYVYRSSPLINHCIFVANSAGGTSGGGGICNQYSNPSILNNIFVGNSSGSGGAIYNINGSGPIITNCTFYGNYSTNYGGAMYNYDGSPTVTNSILWDNVAPVGSEIYNESGATPVVTYSDLQGGYTGSNNINLDPLIIGYPLSIGTWTSNPNYDMATFRTTLTDNTKLWAPSSLKDLFLIPDTTQTMQYLIFDNTYTTITIWGDVTSFATNGDSYQVFDYHLTSSSPCKDTATASGAPSDDLDGYPRPYPVGGDFDMGAYEYHP